jgi:hypothetical protein
MLGRVHPARRRLVFLSAAIAAVLAVLLPVTAAPAAAVPAAGNRVGAHQPGMTLTVGLSQTVSPGQGRCRVLLQPGIPAGACVAAEDSGADIPSVIYRGGGKAPSNFRLRPGESALSFRDSLSNPLPPGRAVLVPGKEYVGIDTS